MYYHRFSATSCHVKSKVKRSNIITDIEEVNVDYHKFKLKYIQILINSAIKFYGGI